MGAPFGAVGSDGGVPGPGAEGACAEGSDAARAPPLRGGRDGDFEDDEARPFAGAALAGVAALAMVVVLAVVVATTAAPAASAASARALAVPAVPAAASDTGADGAEGSKADDDTAPVRGVRRPR